MSVKMNLSQLIESMQQKPTPEEPRTRYGYAVLRVSDKSRDEQAQRADIERACAQHNLTITRWHREREKANDWEARKSFRQFIEDAKRDPQCEFIMCREASRLLRDDQMIDRLEVDLAAHGVRLIDDHRFISFAADDLTPAHVGMKGMMRLQGKLYSAQCRDWTLSNMRHICQQRDPETGWSYHLGGIPLFGYKRVKVPTGGIDKRGNPVMRELWLLNDEQCQLLDRPLWEVVRLIWLDWYIKRGWGDDKIAEQLTEYSVKSPRGQAFSTCSIRDMRRPISLLTYAGWYTWNKFSFHRLGRMEKKVLKPPSEWVWIPNAHPAIFTMDEIQQIEDCAQKRSERWKRRGISRKAEAARVYLLSGGLAQCKACGSNICGHSYRHRGDREYGYYLCGSWKYRKGAGCGPPFTVKYQQLEDALLQMAVELFPIPPKRAETWTKKANQLLRERLGGQDGQRLMIEQRIREIDAQTERVIEAIARGSALAKQLEQKAKELTQQRKEFERQLDHLPRVSVPELKAENVIAIYERLESAANNRCLPERRTIVREVCKEIVFNPYERQVEVEYYWGGVTHSLVAPRGVEPRLPD